MAKPFKSKRQAQIGIDIESVDRFRKEMPTSNHFFSVAFTIGEIDYCASKTDPPQHFAGIFAAKEAALKAVSRLTAKKVASKNFEVSHSTDGAPILSFLGKDPEIRKVEISISISHTAENAIAVALAGFR
jgi:phosphopantetheine--protein transferase-like protein